MRIKCTKDDIGRELYPIDNSWSQDLKTGERPKCNNGVALAGNADIAPVLVKIISEPYKMISGNYSPEYDQTDVANDVHEYVIVEYKENKYLILNYFTDRIDDEPYSLY